MGENKYTISVDHENRLIRYTHRGKIKQEDIGAAWVEILQIEEFSTGKYNMLSDYRDAEFIAGLKDIKEIIEVLYNIKDLLEGKKQALLMDSPKNTALSMIFEKEVNNRIGFKVEIFSTEKAALDWLMIS